MKLEKQVTSLELSKKLDKLLGDNKPESLFYWKKTEKKKTKEFDWFLSYGSYSGGLPLYR